MYAVPSYILHARTLLCTSAQTVHACITYISTHSVGYVIFPGRGTPLPAPLLLATHTTLPPTGPTQHHHAHLFRTNRLGFEYHLPALLTLFFHAFKKVFLLREDAEVIGRRS